MNKFLELTFSIGKVFSSILLVIALFVMLWSGVGLLSSNNLSVKTPKFNTIKQAYIKESNESTYTANLDNSGSTESSNSFRYIRQIRKIIRKHQLKETLQYEIAKNIDNINEELIPEYLRGLDKFYTDGLKLIENSESFKDNFLYDVVYNEEKDGYTDIDNAFSNARKYVKENGTYNSYIGIGLTKKYHKLFIEELGNSAIQQQENIVNKIVKQVIFILSILIFSILLFLPVLIKIEENTRPSGEKDNTKKCKSCGREIKLNAKKCRYCGAWQDEETNGGNE